MAHAVTETHPLQEPRFLNPDTVTVKDPVDKNPAGGEHGDCMSEWTTILDDLTGYLRWRQELGARTEEFDQETIQVFLASAPGKTVARHPVAAAPAPPLEATAAPAQRTPPRPSAALSLATEPQPSREANDTPEARQRALAAVSQKAAACRLCILCEKRKQTVPGQGHALAPDMMFIGEAPGADEDEQGLAFVGKAGQLLTKMIEAMGYTRDQVFIANICKCYPPDDRQPALEEMQACIPFLRAQIDTIRPKTIVALGATAVKGLLEANTGISRLRGTWTTYNGIPLMPTYHPAYLLRFPTAKKDAWEDLKKVLTRLGKPIPTAKKAAT